MRHVDLAPVGDSITEMQTLYGKFDVGMEGLPSPGWIGRNLCWFRFDGPMRHAFFPTIYVYKAQVNRRMRAALGQAFGEVAKRWSREARTAHGIDQFVKCYCFGDGAKPNLHWYGAAWELSPRLGGGELEETVAAFVRAGFTHDKKRLRTLEYW
jgi:hypothetical protein